MELLAGLFTELQKVISKNPIVIVEGIKDKEALKQLGFTNILVLHGTTFYKKIEKISFIAKKYKKEVIILTDLDKKGKQFYSAIKKELIREGIRVNDKLRQILMKEKISHVEGLPTFMEHIRSNL